MEPVGLAVCTDSVIPGLPGEPGSSWDTPQAVGIIGDQRAAALSKDRCTKDWRGFYSDLRKRMASDGPKP